MAGEENNTTETEHGTSVSSSPVPSAGSSSSSSSDETAAATIFSDQDKQLVLKTEEHFLKKQYSSCLKCLQNLIASLQQNSANFSADQQQQHAQVEFKLLTNKAICEFAQGSCRKVDEFRHELKKLFSDKSKLNLEELDALDTEQHCVVFFNYAIVLYNLKQYSQCLRIVEKIYTQFLDALDEKLGRQVSLMLTNLYIEMRLPHSALNVLQATERLLNAKSSNINPATVVNSSPKSAKTPEESSDEQMSFYHQLISVFKIKCYLMLNSPHLSDKELKQLMSTSSKGIKLSTISNLKMHHDYINESYSTCVKQLIIDCLANLKAIDSSLSNNRDLQQLQAIVNSSFNLNNILPFSSSNGSNMNNQTSLNPILSALGASGVQTNNLLHSNSILFQLFTFTKCLMDLSKSSSSSEQSGDEKDKEDVSVKQNIATLNTVLFNNISLVHYSLQKYNLSSLYLERALNENRKFISSVKKESSESSNGNKDGDNQDGVEHKKNLLGLSAMNRHYELLYNMGVTFLYSKQPVAAFECLSKVAPVFNQNARLWLRMAECCIMHASNSNSKTAKSNESSSSEDESANIYGNERMMKTSEKLKCIQNSLGTGFHHKIVVGNSINRDPVYSGGEALNVSNLMNDDNSSSDSSSLDKLMTFEYAYVCLKNALDLVPSSKEIFGTPSSVATKQHIIDMSRKSSAATGEQQESGEDGLESTSDMNVVDVDTNEDSELTTASRSGKQQHRPSQHLLFNIVWPSKPIDMAELQNLRSSVLVSLSYVSLSLKDYLNAIKYGNMVLDSEEPLNAHYPVSKGNKYLVHSYIAEAQFYLDKINDALEHLKSNSLIDTMNDISFMPQFTPIGNGTENGHHDMGEERNRVRSQNFMNQLKWYYPRDINMFKAIAFYNLAVVYVIRNEIDTSYKYFNLCVNLFEKKQPAYTYFMKLYLDLLDGNRNSLQYVIKDHFGHVTLNRTTQVVSNTATSLVPPSQLRQAAGVPVPGVATGAPNAAMMIGQPGVAAAALGAGVQSSAGLSAHPHLQPHHIQQLQQSTHFQQQLQQQQSHFQQQLQQQQQSQTPAQAQALQLQMQQLQMQLLQHQLQQHQQQQLQSHILQSQPINQFLNSQNPIGVMPGGAGAAATSNAALSLAVAAAAAAAEKNRASADH